MKKITCHFRRYGMLWCVCTVCCHGMIYNWTSSFMKGCISGAQLMCPPRGLGSGSGQTGRSVASWHSLGMHSIIDQVEILWIELCTSTNTAAVGERDRQPY